VWAELNLESISSMDHQYWTYIVASLSGTLYIGMTNKIERRIREYKKGIFEGFARDSSAGVSPAVQGLTRSSMPLRERSNSKAGDGRRKLR
jgi:hypothetical protein